MSLEKEFSERVLVCGCWSGGCPAPAQPEAPRRGAITRRIQETLHDSQDCSQRQGNPPGKLADAELHFADGPLDGLRLIGFAIWERRTGGGRNVTFPARAFSVNGERRSFSLLRPIADSTAQNRIRDLILEAYEAQVPAGVEA